MIHLAKMLLVGFGLGYGFGAALAIDGRATAVLIGAGFVLFVACEVWALARRPA